MSADLIIHTLIVDERREIDFKAARRAIEHLGPEDVEDLDEFDCVDPAEPERLQEVREQLYRDLQGLQDAIANWIDISELRVRGAIVYISGGMSHGDAPTEVCDVISRLRAVRGVLEAAGFEEES